MTFPLTRPLFGLLCTGLGLLACATPAVPVGAPASETGKTSPGSPAGDGKDAIAPEQASDRTTGTLVKAHRYMVAAANPHASRAGLEILQAGGNAVDTAIAMELVLGLVEPQSSGLGGGAFLLTFDAKASRLTSWDGRETAPQSATPGMFLDANGKPRDMLNAIVGGQSVGVPGLVKLLETVHQKQGKLPWARLFEPAIRLAREGFEVSPRLHNLIAADPLLSGLSAARAYFFTPAGDPLPVGFLLKNPAYAEVLATVAERGSAGFYTGPIAQDIVNAITQAEKNPAPMTLADLAGWHAIERPAVCSDYEPGNPPPMDGQSQSNRRQQKQVWKVCSMGPPSSGGIAVEQILGLVAPFELSKRSPDSVEVAHVFAEASRLAFADRAQYVADPDFGPVPTQGLLAPGYVQARSKLIRLDKSMGLAQPGQVSLGGTLLAPDRSPELPSTSHLVVVDGEGNAVSMTATVESAFGSRLMVRGFLLNNELTDFSFLPEENGLKVANRIEPGKRPRSSMTPVLVLDERGKRVVLALGSPGGSQIISYVARTLLSVGEWGMELNTAIARPHIVNRNGRTELEKVPGFEGWLKQTQAGLKALGHDAAERELNSGLHGILQQQQGHTRLLSGAADPRREGLVLGE